MHSLSVTFSTLGEKTTVMSPEVLLNAGIPCCRLVQNVGEFVVTFPRAYHSGFSHGFNCGEASNIATPEWLRFAKDAAMRRASINCPPMVSHFQLLYDLALSPCPRVPKNIQMEPKSSRLKDRRKGEGDTLVKELFVQDLKCNNSYLDILGEGSSVVLLPRNSRVNSIPLNFLVGTQLKVKQRLFPSLSDPDHEVENTRDLVSYSVMLGRKQRMKQVSSVLGKGKYSPWQDETRLPDSGKDDDFLSSPGNESVNLPSGRERAYKCEKLSEQGLFSCVTCGILCYTCVALIQPTEAAAQRLSSDIHSSNDWTANVSGFTAARTDSDAEESDSISGWMAKRAPDGLFDVPIQATDQIPKVKHETVAVLSNTKARKETSSLGLLALIYGNSSDSDEDEVEADIPVEACESRHLDCEDGVPPQITDPYANCRQRRAISEGRNNKYFDCSIQLETENSTLGEDILPGGWRHQILSRQADANCIPLSHKVQFTSRSDEDSSRMHVFCLQHAVHVEQQLRAVGGAHVFLLCHPDYPKLEAQAKEVAEELGSDHFWSDISFREATKEDEEMIQTALEIEEAIHGNGDWSVKLGINLFYSANLSRSPLYSKQMPYNFVIYTAFGRSSPDGTSTKSEHNGRRSGKRRKVVVAGKWCGKVWMSSQVHPLLAERDPEEREHENNIPSQLKPNVKSVRSFERTQTTKSATTTCKTGTKKKITAVNRTVSNAKFLLADDLDEDSLNDVPQQQGKRSSRSKRIKTETPEPQKDDNKKKFGATSEDELEGGPSTRLRKRMPKPSKELTAKSIKAKPAQAKQHESKKAEKGPRMKVPSGNNKSKKGPRMKVPGNNNNSKARNEEEEYPCNLEGCSMSFSSKQELLLHKKNVCPVKGCGKKFFSHKYLIQHRRVHIDDRPLKCPWKGCKMTFKWAWARTEHIRVHTGERPYVCTDAGCGKTFRFVSDFSRHRRKTGHTSEKGRG